MADVFDVAKYFINKSEAGTKESITNLKLQKLLYYAQGFFLSLNSGEKLFDEEIQAWVHGPVVPPVYKKYKDFSYNEITERYASSDITLTKNESLLLDDVWEIFKSHSGKDLERVTHSEDPWLNARRGLSDLEHSNEQINLNGMKRYFEREYLVE